MTSNPSVSPPEASDVPVPRRVDQPWMSLAEWQARHEAQLTATERGTTRLVLVGDSITQMWAETDAYRALASYRPLNLGIGGDQTQHVLWRVEHGSLMGTNPRLVVLLIGVNNLGNGHEPAQTARGVLAVVGVIRRELPKANVLVLGILPTGALPTDPMRQKAHETNRLLAQAKYPYGVRFHDLGAALVEADGTISSETMADGLHPTPRGFVKFTEALSPLIEQGLARARDCDALPVNGQVRLRR